ncbi:MAG: efflux RND transporter permease subunit [bacterium]
MYISHFSIRRPVAATMLIAMLVVFGIIGLSRLGISLFPNIDYPIITVSTEWRNARPEEVDNEITDELEDAISSVSGIKHINSESSSGRSRITVEFELDKDIDVAAQEVRDKVSAKLDDLPEDAEIPTVDKQDVNAQPVIWLSLTGQYAIDELTRVADDLIRPMLQKINGVGEVRLGGDRRKEVHIRLNRDRLAAYQIGVNEVISAIQNQHVEVPSGKVESSKQEYLIRTMGEFKRAKDFEQLIVAMRNNEPVRIKDIGYSIAGREEGRAVAKFSTKTYSERTVSLGVTPRSGANEVAIARGVKQMIPDLRALLPEGMVLNISNDRSVFIEQSINEVRGQLVIGGILAALVIYLFLQNSRTTLISSIAIPTSILSTFACMYMMGFTMNNMTMLGLVVAVGIVIDDAIVMVENIYRHRYSLRKSAMQAAYDASEEIGFAIISTTLVLGGVFLPVAFMGGMTGRLFFEFAITMAFAIVCSSLVALTVVPMLSSRFLTIHTHRWFLLRMFEAMMDRAISIYRYFLNWFLRHRLAIIMLALLVLAGSVELYNRIGKEFTSPEDQGRIFIRVQAPLSYSIEKTGDVIDRILAILDQVPEVSHTFSIAGTGSGNQGIVYTTLFPRNTRTRSQQEIQTELRAKLKELPDVRASVTDISPLGGRSRSEDIQLVIQGPNIEMIDYYSNAIMEALAQRPGYVGITRNLEIGKPEVRVQIDREKAADAGIQVRDIASTVGALIGGVEVAQFKEGGKSYDIRVRLDPEQRLIPEDVQRIWIRDGNGELVDIKNFVHLQTGVGPSVINRMDRQRSATVYASLENKVLGQALEEVQALADEILPEGYTTKHAGNAESFQDAGSYIIFVFVLSILLTYMILAAQFESFIHPFSIMMGLPLASVGAFGLLMLLDNTLNLYSMIGLVLLVGLAAKNGILLVEYTNQLRDRGYSVHDALVEAGAVRLRPILMTAISTIAGVIPVVLGLGEGSESRQPMGVAISGGMISSTFLTLAVVPVVYSYLDQFSHWRLFAFMKRRLMADSSHPQTQPQPQIQPTDSGVVIGK